MINTIEMSIYDTLVHMNQVWIPVDKKLIKITRFKDDKYMTTNYRYRHGVYTTFCSELYFGSAIELIQKILKDTDVQN